MDVYCRESLLGRWLLAEGRVGWLGWGVSAQGVRSHYQKLGLVAVIADKRCCVLCVVFFVPCSVFRVLCSVFCIFVFSKLRLTNGLRVTRPSPAMIASRPCPGCPDDR